MKFEKMKEKDGVPLYESPLLEPVDVAVETGFATSGTANEGWTEIPGGGSF